MPKVRAPPVQLIYKATFTRLAAIGLTILLGLGCGSGREEAASPFESTTKGINDDLKPKRIAIVIEDGVWGKEFLDEAPKVGEEAPDFGLKPLKFYGFKTEESDITEENAGLLYEPVRLSSFRGKRPVVLIFGSYT